MHLHRTSLKNRTSDYVTVLGDLGKEQKFEVTYVEVDEKTDDDQVGFSYCLFYKIEGMKVIGLFCEVLGWVTD